MAVSLAKCFRASGLRRASHEGSIYRNEDDRKQEANWRVTDSNWHLRMKQPYQIGWRDILTFIGTVVRDFRLQFFSWISFTQAPEYSIGAVSNFVFEHSRRYSQLKLHHQCHRHQWQREKIFSEESLNFLFGHLWVVQLFPSVKV
jgi:hypothetical protein